MLDLPADLIATPRRTRDWRAAGVTDRELAGPLWRPVLRGVHSWVGAEDADPTQRIAAAAELMPNNAAIGGWASLHLHGVRDLDGRTGAAAAALLPVLVCLGPVGRMRRRAGIAIDRSVLLSGDVTDVDGIRVTTAVRSPEGDPGLRRDPGRHTRGHRGQNGRRALEPSDRLLPRESPARRLGARSRPPNTAGERRGRRRHGFLLGIADLLDKVAALIGEYDGEDHRTLARHTSDNVREEGLERSNLVVVRATALDLWPRRLALVARIQAAHRDGLARDRSRDR